MITDIALVLVVAFTTINVVLQLLTRRTFYSTIVDLRQRVLDLERHVARMRAADGQ